VDGWNDRQLPDGTVVWTSPWHTYTTRPGSRLLLPTLTLPTGELPPVTAPAGRRPRRGVMMPRRRITRAADRARRIMAERQSNGILA
jgi:hypothetical protein